MQSLSSGFPPALSAHTEPLPAVQPFGHDRTNILMQSNSSSVFVSMIKWTLLKNYKFLHTKLVSHAPIKSAHINGNPSEFYYNVWYKKTWMLDMPHFWEICHVGKFDIKNTFWLYYLFDCFVYFPKPDAITANWLVPNYTPWQQRHKFVNVQTSCSES